MEMAFRPQRGWWPQRRRVALPTTSPSWCCFYASPKTLWPTASETPKPALWMRAHRVPSSASSALEQTTKRESALKATSATLPKPVIQMPTSLKKKISSSTSGKQIWRLEWTPGFDIGKPIQLLLSPGPCMGLVVGFYRFNNRFSEHMICMRAQHSKTANLQL
uniref:Uncharacterized protein n=1 Tax=Micrurus corallinus TaxID=54390 RepID=A0A2D4GAB0_MICCO